MILRTATSGKPRRDERGLGRAFHKIPRVICFKRESGIRHSMLSRHSTVFTSANESCICFQSVCRNSVADFIACTQDRDVVYMELKLDTTFVFKNIL